MSDFLSLVSQYELLVHTAKYLSTLDLFRLALTKSEFYGLILQSSAIFNRLKLSAICDGTGLRARQHVERLYALRPEDSSWGKDGRKSRYDGEIEVRVWILKCDAGNALPCRNCGINVCEECRYVPVYETLPDMVLVGDLTSTRSRNIICYCKRCDNAVEADIPLSLSEYCDCDQYTRWICLRYKETEAKVNTLCYKTRTKYDYQWDQDLEDGMCLSSHVDRIAFWCPCGSRAPKDGNRAMCVV
ncbi:hypothetical protein DL98DRAFT_518383 [Cadophora sp. DSE1049]|nr:hypothetical protein DL98DRAFT_518383 [Cadophora sp. DSE1049]